MPPWNATIRRPWSAGSTRPTKPTPGSISVKKRSKRHAGTSWRVENFWRQFVLNRVTVLVQKEIAHSIFWSFHSKDVNIFFLSTAENVSCKQLTTWTCPNDHSFDSIPQCEQGIPQECPECCLDKVREYSDDVTKVWRGRISPKVMFLIEWFK